MGTNRMLFGAIIATTLMTACSTTPSSIEHVEWVLQSIDGQSVPAASAARMVLSADDQLSGFAGCNRFHGRYDRASGEVKRVSSTRRACEPTVMQMETRFLDALSHSVGLTLAGNDLRMTTDTGATLMFRAEKPQP